MKIHRKLIIFVALGMLLIMAITVGSLYYITSVFSRTIGDVGKISAEVRQLWNIEREMAKMSVAVHDFIASGDGRYRASYDASQSAARLLFSEMGNRDLSTADTALLGSATRDFQELGEKAARVFSLRDPTGADRRLAYNLMIEIEDLLQWMGRDMERYKDENAAYLTDLVGRLNTIKTRVDTLFVIVLVTTVAFLLAFGLYLYRKVSIPLGNLWDGAEAISRGNLDHQMQSIGERDIAALADRFNDMAQKLKLSYADLEQKLLQRTRELAALSSVALALGEGGSLGDVLHSSLLKILESLSRMEPRGGIFLCDPDGKRLRLVAQEGLGEEFVRSEATIRMGECLCGLAAQTGEMLTTEQGCNDPRHTRGAACDDHSHIIIPIKSRGAVFGVLFLYPEKSCALNPSDLQMFDTIGSQLGIAVENSRLYGKVKESGEKYWDLFENSRDILCTLDRGGRITAVNGFAAQFLGHSKSELIGENIGGFLTAEGREKAEGALTGDDPQAEGLLEFEIIKKDGSRAVVEVSARKMYKDGGLVGFQLSGRDVTEQKNLRELLVKAERLAAMGQMGIAVRHEINNPLTTIIGNTELLLDRYENASEDLRTRLQAVLDNSLRIAEIVKRLKEIKEEKTVEYLHGVKMTDLKERP